MEIRAVKRVLQVSCNRKKDSRSVYLAHQENSTMNLVSSDVKFVVIIPRVRTLLPPSVMFASKAEVLKQAAQNAHLVKLVKQERERTAFVNHAQKVNTEAVA